MATPTITSVTPNTGHTGGKTLVEIVGTNFQLLPDPPATGPVPVANPSLRVLFGTTPALKADVWSATQIYCVTPKLDPITVVQEFTADAGTDTLTAASHGLVNDQRVSVRLQDPAGATDALPAGLQAKTAYFVVGATAGTFQLSTSVGGGAVDITDAGTGTFEVVSEGSVDVKVEHLDQDGNTIGEDATALAAYTPVRPDLSVEGHLATVVGEFLDDLRRQILENVAWSTDTDYDDDTGDTVSIAHLASLPAMLVVGLGLPENRDAAPEAEQDHESNDPAGPDGDFYTTRPAVVVDLVGIIVGVTDNPVELLNMFQALRGYFKKNIELEVPRDRSDPSAGTVTYDMEFSFGSDVAITPQSGNDNIQTFAGNFRISEIRLEVIPGLPTATVPGVPAGVPAENILSVGKTADVVTPTVEKK